MTNTSELKCRLVFTILIVWVINSHLFSQSKQVVIQIDTIDSFDPIETLLDFEVNVTNQGLFYSGNFDSTAEYSYSGHPQYLNTVPIYSDTSEIEIPIDLNGSVIILLGAYSMDTIRINKLNIYNTQPPDTTYAIIYKYRKIDGNLDSKPFKAKRKVTWEKAKSPPETIRIQINNVMYECPLKLTKLSGYLITHGHGYNRRKYIDKNGDYKKKLIYMYLSSETVQYQWRGVINLTK